VQESPPVGVQISTGAPVRPARGGDAEEIRRRCGVAVHEAEQLVAPDRHAARGLATMLSRLAK
jgi:hypothetical protein